MKCECMCIQSLNRNFDTLLCLAFQLVTRVAVGSEVQVVQRTIANIQNP